MLSTTERPIRLPSLTGLRFIASAMVLLCHTGMSIVTRAAPGSTAWAYVYEAGVIGVTFFFVLSGFVLTWTSKAGDTKRAFWRRRVVKIFPNHIVTLVAALILMASAGVAVSVPDILPTILLQQSWFVSQDIILLYNPNGPTWSLTCEIFFYLIFPFMLPLLRRIRPERLWGWAGAVVVLMAAVPFIAKVLPAEPLLVQTTSSWPQTWFIYYFPVTRALEFVLGVLVGLIVVNKRWRGPGVLVSGLLAIAGYAVSAQLVGTYSGFAIAAVPIALLIAAVATADIRGRRTAFGGRKMVWLGEISFALYMVHWLVVSYGPLDAANPMTWTTPLNWSEAIGDAVLTIAICLVLAWLLYAFVERPAMRAWSRPAKGGGRLSAVPDVPLPVGDGRRR